MGYNIETGQLVELSPPGGFGEIGRAVDPSKTDKGLVWVHGEKGAWEVWEYDEEAGEYEKIYETERFLRHPVLRDNILLFVIKETGYDEIYAHNLDTGEEEQLTNDKLLILRVFYEEPYLVWKVWAHGSGIKIKKWKWG